MRLQHFLILLFLVISVGAEAAGFRISPGGNTDDKPQSKIWVHDGSFWAIVRGPSGVAIHERVAGQWQVGGFMDAAISNAGSADVKWDGTHLFVIVHTLSPKLYKYSYDTDFRAWTLRSGFPVAIPNPSGSETMVLDEDSTGRLWTVAESGGDIEVHYSLDSTHKRWSGPVVLRSGVSADDIASVIAFGGDRIGVFWSDQNRDEFGFRYHVDGAPPTQWSAREIVYAKSMGIDDHINLAAESNGRVLAITKDDHDHMQVHRRELDGEWIVRENVLNGVGTRGMIMLSDQDNRAYIAYTSWETQPHRIEYCVADLDSLFLDSPTPLIVGTRSMNNATGMKQSLPAGTFVVLAQGGGDLWWNGWGEADVNSDLVPPPPMNLGLEPGPGQINLAWETGSDLLPDYFIVERQVDGDVFERLNASPILVTGYTDSSVPNGLIHYRVRSVEGALWSSPSNTASVTHISADPPGATGTPVLKEVAYRSAQGALVLWFDEAVGQSANDLSGFQNHARLGSSVQEDRADPVWMPGIGGSALNFDGDDDYLYIEDAASLDVASDFTITAWVRHDSGTRGTVINKGTRGNRNYRVVVTSTGKVEFRWESQTGSVQEVVTGSIVEESMWTHIACVYDAQQQENRVYVNGILRASVPTLGVPSTNGKQCHVGVSLSTSLKDYFHGGIDQLRLVPQALFNSDFTPSVDPGAFGSQDRTSVLVTWTPPSSGGTPIGYRVRRSVNGGLASMIHPGSLGGTAFSDDDLVDGDLCYTITAVNVENEEGPQSSQACLSVTIPPPTAPQGLSLQLQGTNPESISLLWTSPDAATPGVIGYNIYRASNGGSFLPLNDSPVATLSYSDPNLLVGDYCYKVSALDSMGREGAASDSVCMFVAPPPPPAPGMPLNIQVIQVTSSGIPKGALLLDFDEGTGQVIRDQSSQNLEGQLGTSSGPDEQDPVWSPGIHKGALRFDGTDDRVTIPDSDPLDFSGSFTIEAWVQRASTGTRHCIVSKGESNARNFWLRFTKSGYIEFVWEDSTGANHGAQTGSPVGDFEWHHIAALFDQESGESRIYLDGILVKSKNDSGTPITNAEVLYLGARRSRGVLKDFFDGRIDLLRISAGAVYDANFSPPNSFVDATPQPSAQITWSPPTTGRPTGYRVFRSIADGTPTQLTPAPVAEPIFLDESLTSTPWPDSAVCYFVSAVDSLAQQGSASAPVCLLAEVPPLPPTPPSPPTHLSAVAFGALTLTDSVVIVWEMADSSSVNIYEIEHRFDADLFELLDTTSQRLYVHLPVRTGTHCYRVVAIDSLGLRSEESESGCVEVIVPAPSLAAPTQVQLAVVQVPGGSAVEGTAAFDFEEGLGQPLHDVTEKGHDGFRGTTASEDAADPQWSVGTSGSQALHFDGLDDFVTIPEAATLGFSSSFTLEAWVKRDTFGKRMCVMGKGDSNNRNYWLMLTKSGYIEFRWETSDGTNHGTMSRTKIADTGWHHIAGVYDQLASLSRIFVDGVLWKEQADFGTPVINDDILVIGARRSRGILKNHFEGSLDLVRVSSGALYSEEFVPPLAFVGLRNALQLSWASPTNPAVTGFDVFRRVDSDSFIALTIGLQDTLLNDPLIQAGLYCYYVQATDSLQQKSAPSDTLCFDYSDTGPPSPMPPTAPLAVTARLFQLPTSSSSSLILSMNEADGQQLDDLSGHGNHGLLGTTAVADASDPRRIAAIEGGGISLDGVDDFVIIADSPSLDQPGSFSVEAWAQRLSTGRRQAIITKGGINNRNYWLQYTKSGYIEFRWETAGGTNHGTITSFTVTDGLWHHIAGVYDREAGVSRIFLDGVLVKQRNDSGTPLINVAPVLVGARQNGSAHEYFFDGNIDLVRVSSEAIYSTDFVPPEHFEIGESQIAVRVTWSPPDSGSAVGYNVFRRINVDSLLQLNPVMVGGFEFVEPAVPFGSLCYVVTAIDELGQESALSDSACVVHGVSKVVLAGGQTTLAGLSLSVGPNPFNPSTTIRFNLATPQSVRLNLFDVRGRRVKQLIQGKLEGGTHSIVWDGRLENGRPAASGAYFMVLQTASTRKQMKLILLK